MLVRTDSIIVLSEQPDSVQKTELAVQTADFRNVPDDHFKCIMTMPTLKLQQETTLNGTQGDACSISAKDGAVYLSSTDLGRVLTVTKRVLSSSNKVSLVINNTLPAVSFGTQYFRKLLNALMSSDNTTLSVANQIPLKISQPIMEFTNTQEKAEIAGDLAYFVAPKMNEGVENDDFVMPEAFSKTREACFQGQFIHGRKFADIMQSLGKDFGQVVLECSETRLRIRGMCRSHISLAVVDLTTKDFSLLECDKAFSIGCGLQHLAQVLEGVKETDVVSLAIHETKEEGLFPWIELTVHSGANQDEITVKEIVCCDDVDTLVLSSAPYSATVGMPSSLFRYFVTALEGTTCEIGITRDGVLFSSDNSSLSILNTDDVQVSFKVQEAVKLVFDLSRLRMFAKMDSVASSTVHLSLLPSCPLRLQFSTATSKFTTYLSLFLAPIVDDVEGEDCTDCTRSQPPMTAEEELGLSHQIHSSKKAAMISSETTSSNARRQSKRRRTPSTDRKRPRKKRAPSKKPTSKKCAHCLETKGGDAFFAAELRKTKFAKCIDCALVSCELNMFLSNHELADQGGGNADRVEVRALRSLGCERYECPIFFDNKNDNIVTSLQASFNPAFPDVTTLLGSYDIVYAFSDWGSVVDGKPRYKQRSVHGLLNLTCRHLVRTGSNGLYGVVEMDPTIGSYVEPHGGSFSFAQVMGDESSPSFELPVTIDNYPRDAEAFQRLGESTGTISLLARRTATTWNPVENPSEEPWLPMSWEKRIISFETSEDAEKLVECWKKSFLAHSWIINHLSLPAELALRIHEYVAFRPCPAFFFERDDLWISTNWRRDEQPTLKTILVARRRTS